MSRKTKDKLDIASDIHTPEAELLQLAHKQQPIEVRRAVARNPNAPIQALFILSEDFASDVEANPSLPMWELVGGQNEDQKAGLEFALTNIAARTVDMDRLERSARSPSHIIRRGAAYNPLLPASLAFELAQDDSPSVRMTLSANPATPAEVMRLLSSSIVSTKNVIEHANTPLDVLEHYANDTTKPGFMDKARKRLEERRAKGEG